MDILTIYKNHKNKILDYYEEETGEEFIKEPSIYEKKDLTGRWLFKQYFDGKFKQGYLEDRVDGAASGAPCEIKCNTYGFNELDQVIIDKSKVDIMPDDGRIVFLYPEEDGISKRQFVIKDIKKYGRLSNSGGKVDNNTCRESDKPVYYVGHEYAEDECTWKKGEGK